MSNYIGVKQVDGTITRVLTYKLNNSQNISCAPFTDDQEKVKIDSWETIWVGTKGAIFR